MKETCIEFGILMLKDIKRQSLSLALISIYFILPIQRKEGHNLRGSQLDDKKFGTKELRDKQCVYESGISKPQKLRG
jgi:hypothetical protein